MVPLSRRCFSPAAHDLALRYVPGSGGHTHAKTPVSPFFKEALGSRQTLLDPIDLSTLSGASPAAPLFDPVAGELFAQTGQAGGLSFKVAAGEVCGQFEVRASGTGGVSSGAPILVPGAPVIDATPVGLAVALPGLVAVAVIRRSTT